MNHLRLVQLARLTAGYSLATLAGPFFTIVLTPLYTRVLRPEDYAILDTTTTFGILAMTLGTFGLGGAATAYYYDEDAGYGRRIMTTACLLALAWALLLALLVAVMAQPLALFLLGSHQNTILFYLVAINVPLGVCYSMLQTNLRLLMAVKRANALALTFMVLTACFNILFVLVLRWNVFGVQLAMVLTNLGVSSVGLALTWHHGWGRPSWSLARPLVRTGLPLVPASLSFWALAYVDRLLLPAYAVALNDRGQYAIANKLASMLTLITVPFQSAWGPLALSMRNDPEAPRTYAKVLTYYMIGGLGLALALALFAKEILLVFTTPAYVGAAPMVSLLGYAAVGTGAHVAVGVGAYLTKRTDLLGWTTMAGAGLNFGLNLVLIPWFGIWGAAWATALSYLAMPIWLALLSQRLYPVPFETWKVGTTLALQAALLAIAFWLAPVTLWSGVAIKGGLLAGYLAGLLLLRLVEPSEARALVAGILRFGGAMLGRVRT
jgi:O-antigen/teichoic acid export membrane protein